ncbi:MAG: hypothetical protein PVH61_27260, partial [Candidatus Aminicenantes bacterium]
KGFGEILLYHIKELFSTKNNIQNPLCYYISHSLGIKKWGVTRNYSPYMTKALQKREAGKLRSWEAGKKS